MEKRLTAQRERLAQIDRLSTFGEMSANIAHQVNQPLTAIALYSQTIHRLLNHEDVDKRKVARLLEKLNDQVFRAGAVLECIQNYLHPEPSVRRLVELNSVLLEIQTLIVSDLHSYGISLGYSLIEPSPTVSCDPMQVQQVLVNLVRNSVDSMLDVGCRFGHQIYITCQLASANMVTVSVRDSGGGLTQESASLIFEPFQSTKERGTGMGLSVSRTLVEQNYGRLWGDNNSDVGATFSFTLPTQSKVASGP